MGTEGPIQNAVTGIIKELELGSELRITNYASFLKAVVGLSALASEVRGNNVTVKTVLSCLTSDKEEDHRLERLPNHLLTPILSSYTDAALSLFGRMSSTTAVDTGKHVLERNRRALLS
jgi:hypothetical protein